MTTPDSTITTLDNAPAAPSKAKASKATASQSSIQSDAANTASADVASTPPAPELSGEMVTLTIHRGSGDGGADDVFLSHNGYARLVKRDRPVVVPKEVAQVIADAKEISYRYIGDKLEEQVVPRYAYSITPA